MLIYLMSSIIYIGYYRIYRTIIIWLFLFESFSAISKFVSKILFYSVLRANRRTTNTFLSIEENIFPILHGWITLIPFPAP
jgi:hypothetical protein